MNKKYKIREIFYSLQGEGGRQGEASIFIRFAFCNKNCWFCDTDWSYGDDLTLNEIYNEIKQYKCKWIVLTGGEPTLQIDECLIGFFKKKGYKLAIETNGTNRVLNGIDYITCSPKVKVDILNNNFPDGVDEFRFPCGKDEVIPDISLLPKASNYYVSPLFLGEVKKRFEMDDENIQFCINFVKDNPEWKLSLQVHKIINIR